MFVLWKVMKLVLLMEYVVRPHMVHPISDNIV